MRRYFSWQNGLLILIIILASAGLFHSGIYPSHDGEYHIIRFYEFFRSFSFTNLYPRWSPDLEFGYGVPLFTYVYPLPNFIAAFLHIFSFSFINAFKIELGVAVVMGTIFSFLWIRDLYGEKAGIIASAFYTFAPYHFLDIYIRGSIGEVWALALFPAFLWSIGKSLLFNKQRYFVCSSIFLSLIIFSHNILALMFLPFAVLYCVLFILGKKNKRNDILKLVFIFLLSLGISAIFWMPALLEKKYVTGLDIYDVTKQFPDLFDLLVPSWGSGFSTTDLSNNFSVQIGIANLLIVLIATGSLVFLFLKFIAKRSKKVFLIPNGIASSFILATTIILPSFFILSFFVIFLLILPVSASIWKIIPLMNFFQFPWRFLSLEILCTAFLAGWVYSLFAVKFKRVSFVLFLVLLALPILFSFDYAHPAHYFNRKDQYYISRSNFIDGTNSVGNAFNSRWAKNISSRSKKITGESRKVSVLSQRDSANNHTFQVKVFSQTAFITLHTLYFPNWKATIDGKDLPVLISSHGAMQFKIPHGVHTISVWFGSTFVETLATVLSLISFAAVFGIAWYNKEYEDWN